MDINENTKNLIYAQAEISIKDLREILDNHDEKDTMLVNFLRGTSVIDIKVLNPMMQAQINCKVKTIEGSEAIEY